MEISDLVERRIGKCFWNSEWKPSDVKRAIDIMQYVYSDCDAHGGLYHTKNNSVYFSYLPKQISIKFIVKDWSLENKAYFLNIIQEKFNIDGFSYYSLGVNHSSGKLEASAHDYGYNISFSIK